MALEEIRALSPQVALLDVTTPELDGLEVLARSWTSGSPTTVVLLSVHLSAHAVFPAMSRDAVGYLTKATDRRTIRGARRRRAR